MEEEDELIPADSGNDVRFPKGVSEAMGQGDQHEVAGLVTETVVDWFEAVQVDDEKGKPLFFPVGQQDKLFQVLIQEPSVGKTGEGVLEGDEVNALVGLEPGHRPGNR